MLNTTRIEVLAPLPAGARVTVLEGNQLRHGVIADRAGLGLAPWEVAVLYDTGARGPWPFARHEVEPLQFPNIVEVSL